MDYQALDPSKGGLVVDELPDHLRRGVHYGVVMANFGRLLRTRPDTLTKEAQALLHNYTAAVAKLAYFFSHCWGSPGYQKYIALLLYYMSPLAGAAGLGATLGMLLWHMFGPPLLCFPMENKSMGVPLCLSPWAFVVGCGAACMALVLGPFCVSTKPAFLDATCIPQAPLEAKLEGIRHLPSFLKACDELIIAWDPLYFTRGWCVYELAMYQGLFPERRVTVLPIKYYTVMFFCAVWNAAGAAVLLVFMPLFGDATLPSLISTIGLGMAVAHAGEELELQKRELDDQLTNFDFEKSRLQVESDREEIRTSINTLWSGGVPEFNQRVRTDVRDEVLAKFAGCRAMLPWSFMIIACFPNVACMATIYNPLMTLQAKVCWALITIAWPCFFNPCNMALAMKLASMCVGGGADAPATTTHVPWRCRHLGIGVLYSFLVVFFNVMFYAVPVKLAVADAKTASMQQHRWYGPLLCLFGTLGTAAIALWLFWPTGAAPSARAHSKGAVLADP